MEWDLENQEQVGVEDRGFRPARRGPRSLLDRLNKRFLLYAGLVLVPVVLFVLMLILAKR
jgi:hypothetical protein